MSFVTSNTIRKSTIGRKLKNGKKAKKPLITFRYFTQKPRSYADLGRLTTNAIAQYSNEQARQAAKKAVNRSKKGLRNPNAAEKDIFLHQVGTDIVHHFKRTSPFRRSKFAREVPDKKKGLTADGKPKMKTIVFHEASIKKQGLEHYPNPLKMKKPVKKKKKTLKKKKKTLKKKPQKTVRETLRKPAKRKAPPRRTSGK